MRERVTKVFSFFLSSSTTSRYGVCVSSFSVRCHAQLKMSKKFFFFCKKKIVAILKVFKLAAAILGT